MSESSERRRENALLGWRHFAHMADVGICGWGPGPGFAFEQAAIAMTAVMTEAPVATPEHATIVCRATSLDDLFVAFLNAIAFEMAIRELIFGDFAVKIEGARLCAAAYGEPIDQAKHQPACEVKGATYTALRVAPAANGIWTAQCVLDV